MFPIPHTSGTLKLACAPCRDPAKENLPRSKKVVQARRAERLVVVCVLWDIRRYKERAPLSPPHPTGGGRNSNCISASALSPALIYVFILDVELVELNSTINLI